MLKGFTKNGELINVLVSDEGKVLVEGAGGSSGGETTINNTAENPVPVNITNEKETTLNASIQQIGTTETTININKKITTIDIANYSETANITITIGEFSAIIGSNIATTLTINKEVQNIYLSSTENNTKVQIIVKGVE